MGRTRKVIKEIQLVDDDDAQETQETQNPVVDESKVEEKVIPEVAITQPQPPPPTETLPSPAKSPKKEKPKRRQPKPKTTIRPTQLKPSEADIRRKIEAEYATKAAIESKLRKQFELEYEEKFRSLNVAAAAAAKKPKKHVKYKKPIYDDEEDDAETTEDETDLGEDEYDEPTEMDYNYRRHNNSRARDLNLKPQLYSMIFHR